MTVWLHWVKRSVTRFVKKSGDIFFVKEALIAIDFLGYFEDSPNFKLKLLQQLQKGNGYGSIDRAVASDTRGMWFESSHRQLLLNQYFLLTVCRKDENKEKVAGNVSQRDKLELSPTSDQCYKTFIK